MELKEILDLEDSEEQKVLVVVKDLLDAEDSEDIEEEEEKEVLEAVKDLLDAEDSEEKDYAKKMLASSHTNLKL